MQSKLQTVKQFNGLLSKRGIIEGRGHISPNSYRTIATFLSKNGKAVSYVTVKNYLDVHDKVKPEIVIHTSFLLEEAMQEV